MSLSDERKLVQNNSEANEAQACQTEVSFILLWTEGVPTKKKGLGSKTDPLELDWNLQLALSGCNDKGMFGGVKVGLSNLNTKAKCEAWW